MQNTVNHQYTHIIHPFEPVYDNKSEVLILGTLPSVKSRENNFYYGNKLNRFWKVFETLYSEEIRDSIESKASFLLAHRIAIWDVVFSCDIVGSSDNSIKNVTPTNILGIIKETKIKRIFANGKKAEELYNKCQYESTQMKIIPLPSTSPANAAWSIDRLVSAWKVIVGN